MPSDVSEASQTPEPRKTQAHSLFFLINPYPSVNLFPFLLFIFFDLDNIVLSERKTHLSVNGKENIFVERSEHDFYFYIIGQHNGTVRKGMRTYRRKDYAVYSGIEYGTSGRKRICRRTGR